MSEKKGWFSRLTEGLSRSSKQLTEQVVSVVVPKKPLDQAQLDALAEMLIEADLGPHSAARITQRFGAERFGRSIDETDAAKSEQFVRVSLPADSVRGGVPTQTSILKVTANGTVSAPVLRGGWVMKRLLGQPPPPPPPGIPGVEPDTRGASTIREILAKHSTSENCAGCHAKIDPPGFALESFDVIGG